MSEDGQTSTVPAYLDVGQTSTQAASVSDAPPPPHFWAVGDQIRVWGEWVGGRPGAGAWYAGVVLRVWNYLAHQHVEVRYRHNDSLERVNVATTDVEYFAGFPN